MRNNIIGHNIYTRLESENVRFGSAPDFHTMTVLQDHVGSPPDQVLPCKNSGLTNDYRHTANAYVLTSTSLKKVAVAASLHAPLCAAWLSVGCLVARLIRAARLIRCCSAACAAA
jgi:hypothetical protein